MIDLEMAIGATMIHRIYDDDSDEEFEELDEVEANEKILDNDVESIEEAAHVASKNFEQSVVLVEAPVIVETSVVVES